MFTFIRKKACLFIITLIGLLILFYPQPTKAEVATSNDWIGLFPVDSEKLFTSAISWKSTGSGVQDCQAGATPQTPSSRPWLAGGCTFTLPTQPGAYEFRLFGNGKDFNSTSQDNPWLAQSNVFWIPFTLQPLVAIPNGIDTNTVKILISWDPVAGTTPTSTNILYSPYEYYDVFQNGTLLSPPGHTTVTDAVSIVNLHTPYSYFVIAYNSRGFMASNTLSITVDDLPLPPWLKTSYGDVHSNK